MNKKLAPRVPTSATSTHLKPSRKARTFKGLEFWPGVAVAVHKAYGTGKAQPPLEAITYKPSDYTRLITLPLLRISMYEPETSITGFGDSVLVVADSDKWAYRVGKYTGNARPESESYEIKVYDFLTDEIAFTSYYHKEDIYENTKDNAEKLKGLSA